MSIVDGVRVIDSRTGCASTKLVSHGSSTRSDGPPPRSVLVAVFSPGRVLLWVPGPVFFSKG